MKYTKELDSEFRKYDFMLLDHVLYDTCIHNLSSRTPYGFQRMYRVNRKYLTHFKKLY